MRNSNFYRVNFEKEVVVQGRTTIFLSIEANDPDPSTGTAWDEGDTLWASPYIQPQTFESKFEAMTVIPESPMPQPDPGQFRFYFSEFAKNGELFEEASWETIQTGDDVKTVSMYARTPLNVLTSAANAGPINVIRFQSKVVEKGRYLISGIYYYYIAIDSAYSGADQIPAEGFLMQIGNWKEDDNWQINQISAAIIAEQSLLGGPPVYYNTSPIGSNQFDGQTAAYDWPTSTDYFTRIVSGVVNPWSSYRKNTIDPNPPRITYRIDYDGEANSHLKINFLIAKTESSSIAPFIWDVDPTMSAEIARSTVNYGQKLAQADLTTEHLVDYHELHLFGYPETEIKTTRTSYQNEFPNTGSEIYDDLTSYGVLKTNPKLTGNVKLTVDSEGGLWLNSIDASKELSNSRFKKYAISSNSTFQRDLFYFLDQGKLSPKLLYELYQKDDQYLNTKRSLSEQYDNFYNYGIEQLNSKFYDEDYTFMAPLWMRKQLPEFFVIFRLEHPLNPLTYHNSTNPEKFQEFFKDARIVKTFDLRETSPLGTYLRKIVNDPRFKERPLEVSFSSDTPTTWYGIDYTTGNITGKGEFLNDFWTSDNRILDFEETITGGFERNTLISTNLINLEFLFNDTEATPYSINRYYGFYVTENQLAEFEIISEILGAISGQAPLPKIGLDGEPYNLQPFIQSNVNGIQLPIDYFHNPADGTINTSATPEYTGFVNGKFPLPSMVDDPLRFFYVKDRFGNFKRVNKLQELNYGTPGSPSFKRVTQLQLFDNQENISDYGGITQLSSQSNADLLPGGNSQVVMVIEDILKNETPIADYETFEISLEKLSSEQRDYYYRITIINTPIGSDLEYAVQKNDTGIFGSLPEDYIATGFTGASSPSWVDSYLVIFIIGSPTVGDSFEIRVQNGNVVSQNIVVGSNTVLSCYGEGEYLQYKWILEANPVGLSPGEGWDYPVYDPQTQDYKNNFSNRGTPAQVAQAIAQCINSFEYCIVKAESVGDSVYIKSLENFENGNKIAIKRRLKENISVPRNTGFYEKGNSNRGSFTADALTGRIDSITGITSTANGYTSGSYYNIQSTVSPIGGVAAKFDIVVDGTGSISSVIISYGGFGYSDTDTVTIDKDLIGGAAPSADVDLAITTASVPELFFQMKEYTPVYTVSDYFITSTQISTTPDQWSVNIRKGVDPYNPYVTGTSTTYISPVDSTVLEIDEFSIDLAGTGNFSTLIHFEWGVDHLSQYFVGGVRRNRARAAISFEDGKRYYSDRNTNFTGSITLASDQITSVAFPNSLYVGAPISGTGIPVGSIIVELRENTLTVVISKNATEAAFAAAFKAGEISITNDTEVYQQWFQVQKGNYSRLKGWDVQGKYVYSLPYLEKRDFSDYNEYSIVQIDKDRDEFYYTLDKKIVAYQVYRPTFGIFSVLPIKIFDVDTYFSEYSYAPTIELLRYYNREEVGSTFVPFVGNVTIGSDIVNNITFPNDLVVGMPLRDSTFAVGGPYIDADTTIIDIQPDSLPSPSIRISKPAIGSSLIASLSAGILNFTDTINLNMGENYDISIIVEDYTGSPLDTINLELDIEFFDNNDKKWKFVDRTVSILHVDPLASANPITGNAEQAKSLQTLTMNTSYPPYFYDVLEIPNDYLGDTTPPLGPFNSANPQGANAGQDNRGPQYTAVGTRNFVRKLLHTDGTNESLFTKARISAINVWGNYNTSDDPTTAIKYKIRVQGSNYYKDTNITRFAGFSSLTDFLTANDLETLEGFSKEQSFEKFTYQMLLSEYDRLRENQQKDLAVKSKVVPSILKWVQEGTDARDNYYRLNNSSAFGITNFSPDPEVDFTEPLLLTHEFPYLDNVPKDFPEETLEGSRSYFFQKLSDIAYEDKSWYDLLTADNTRDWFTKYFVVGYPNEISQEKTKVPKNREERYTFFKYINGLDLSQTLFRGAKINVIDYDTSVTPKTQISESKRFDLYKFAAIARFVTHHNFEEEKPIDIEVIDNQAFKTILIIVTIYVQDYRLQAGLGDYSFFYYAIDQLRNSMQVQSIGGYGASTEFFKPIYQGVGPTGLEDKYPMEVPYASSAADSPGYLVSSNYFYNNSGAGPWSSYAEDIPKAFSIMRPRQLFLGGGRLELDDTKLGGKAWVGGFEDPLSLISKIVFQPLVTTDGTSAYPFSGSSINYYPVYQEVLPTIDNYRTSVDYYLGGWNDEYTNTFVADQTNGSNVLTAVTFPNSAYVGALVYGGGIPVGTAIIAINSTALTITLSANATSGGPASTYTFQPGYGIPFFTVSANLVDFSYDATPMTVDGFLSEISVASKNTFNTARNSIFVYDSHLTPDDIKLDYLAFSTPERYRSFRVSDITNTNVRATTSTNVGFVTLPANLPSYPPYPYVSASQNFVINTTYNTYQTFNLRGGSLFYQYRKNFISFASISKMFNQQSNYILYRKITMTGAVVQSNPDFSLQFVEFDKIKKLSRYFYSDDLDKPLEYENTEFVGYDLTKTKEQEFEFRHRGLYEPKTNEVLSFWAREDESFTRHFETDYVLKNTHINSASSVAGLMRNYFYNKVSNEEVLQISRTSAYKSLYPLIGEVSIDKRNLSVLDSSWDAGFYRRYTNTKDYTDLSGTQEMLETKVFLGSKAMTVPKKFEFQTFVEGEADFEVILPKKSIGVTTIASPNTVENNSLQTLPVLEIRLDLRARLKRALLEGMLAAGSFDEFSWINSLGITEIAYTSSELAILKSEYIEKNIVPLYEVSQILLYANNKEGLPILELELPESDKLAAGYRTDSNFKNTSLSSFNYLLEKTLDTKAANAYSISAVLKRI